MLSYWQYTILEYEIENQAMYSCGFYIRLQIFLASDSRVNDFIELDTWA